MSIRDKPWIIRIQPVNHRQPAPGLPLVHRSTSDIHRSDTDSPTVAPSSPTGFMGDVTPIHSSTIKLLNPSVITFTDHKSQRALLVRHFMSQMRKAVQCCTDVNHVRTVNPGIPHHVYAP